MIYNIIQWGVYEAYVCGVKAFYAARKSQDRAGDKQEILNTANGKRVNQIIARTRL